MKTFNQRRKEFYDDWNKASKKPGYKYEYWVKRRDELLNKGNI